MAAAAEIPDRVPPTFRFRPTQRELVEFYLLPRARGQDPFPGVIIEDDAAGSSLPWDLFERHGLGSEDEAYFLARAGEAWKPGARQDRGCDGGVGAWKMQSSVDKGLRVGGERILCRRSNLSLHMGKGKSGGSVGWVMHEYTVAAPPCPSPVKICHIAFTGHGRKRKRVPDGQEDCLGEYTSRRARVDAAAAGGRSSGEMLDPDSGAVVHASADEEHSQLVLTDDDIFPQSPLLGSSDFLGFPSAASTNAEQYQELEQQVPSTEEEQVMMPQLMVQQSGMAEQLSAGELEFWSSIGVDVQSSNCAEQEFWSSNGVDSNSVVPGIGDMAGDQQDQQDFWSSFTADVQSNCTVPDMAAGAFGGDPMGRLLHHLLGG
ncbi:hypothetical protein GQ55_1G127000 [Panicum hallii var. hallii]|uniref:NAC domain-containing protein n=1 Tax=Panicum hallii var. hallii TaxID=1504633 RepID=A0A2T7F4Z4_9POAL|nr:hypothetical protein GQ55_1G127000 [Panicum hallii var. hallii]